jgi:hypothetical protein
MFNLSQDLLTTRPRESPGLLSVGQRRFVVAQADFGGTKKPPEARGSYRED